MRRVPVDSSRTNLSRNAPRPSSSMSRSTRSRDLALGLARRAAGASAARERARGPRGGARARRRCSRATVSDGNRRASWNERRARARARWSGAEVGDVVAEQHDRARRRASTKPEMMSNSVVLPAPFGPMRPRISPSSSVEVDVVDGADAAEARARRSRTLERPALGAAVGARRRGACGAPPASCPPAPPAPCEEDRAQDVGAVEQLGGRPAEADLALLHEDGALGDGEGDVDRLLDEDDRRAVLRGCARTMLEQLLDDRPARGRATARRSSAAAAWRGTPAPSVSICCSPPERLPASSSEPLAQEREELEAPARSRVARTSASSRYSHAARRRFSRDGQRREHALAAGHLTMPRPTCSSAGRWRDVLAVEEDGAVRRRRRRPRWRAAASTCRRRWCRAGRRSRPRRPRSRRRTAPAPGRSARRRRGRRAAWPCPLLGGSRATSARPSPRPVAARMSASTRRRPPTSEDRRRR